jgi:hypothetical protein
MTRLVVRKLGSAGDTCVAVTQEELASHLVPELRRGFSVAIRAGDDTRLIGSDLEQILQTVQGEIARGFEEIELLLIPRVQGG